MKVWDEGKDFQTLVKADADIARHLSTEEIEHAFSLGAYLKNIAAIFERVFGVNPEDGP
jgi:adenylosuccinate lyase